MCVFKPGSQYPHREGKSFPNAGKPSGIPCIFGCVTSRRRVSRHRRTPHTQTPSFLRGKHCVAHTERYVCSNSTHGLRCASQEQHTTGRNARKNLSPPTRTSIQMEESKVIRQLLRVDELEFLGDIDRGKTLGRSTESMHFP